MRYVLIPGIHIPEEVGCFFFVTRLLLYHKKVLYFILVFAYPDGDTAPVPE